MYKGVALLLTIVVFIVICSQHTVESKISPWKQAREAIRKYAQLQIDVKYVPPLCEGKVKKGDLVYVKYAAWNHLTNRLFLTNREELKGNKEHFSTKPFGWKVGEDSTVLDGLDHGVLGMCVGEKRQLVIPPELGYGKEGHPDHGIGADAYLRFYVELTDLNPNLEDILARPDIKEIANVKVSIEQESEDAIL